MRSAMSSRGEIALMHGAGGIDAVSTAFRNVLGDNVN